MTPAVAPGSPGTTELPSYAQAVSSWAAHLRDGGTTPWRGWQQTPATGDRRPAALRPLPDAVHLELVRRINLAGRSQGATRGGATDLGALADRVLATPAPGRGLLDVPLSWPGATRTFGSPPLDPAEVPPEELVRLAVGVLAHLLPDLPPSAPAVPPRAPWPLPWRRRFQLHGAPATVAGVRRSLLAQGHVETGWRPTHVVIGRPVDVMMAELWSTSVREGGILKWSTTWRRAQAAGRLPDPIDVSATARRLSDGTSTRTGGRTGRTTGDRRHEPVHVVVARDDDRVAALVAEALRVGPVEIGSSDDASLSDLLRRLNRLAALTRGPGHARDLARRLVGLLERPERAVGTTGDDLSPVAPPAALPWARGIAASSAEALRRDGYAVHGEPDDLAPTEHRLPGVVDREHTLELAVTACLRAWHLGDNP